MSFGIAFQRAPVTAVEQIAYKELLEAYVYPQDFSMEFLTNNLWNFFSPKTRKTSEQMKMSKRFFSEQG